MKYFFALTIITLFAVASYAQDVIVKKNGEEIEAKIIEVHETEIHYKKHNNQVGPTYILNVTSLKEIRYENGDIEEYKTAKKSKKNSYSIKKSEKIVVRSGQYYYQDSQISSKKVKQLFAQHNSDEAITMWNRAGLNHGISYAANIISYPIVILAYFYPFNAPFSGAIQIGGYFVSAGLQVVFYGLRSLYSNQRIEAVEFYNEALKLETDHSNDDYY
ncbi:MAG: hypothetical protein JKY53_06610 [Flavobacteriales bacterium]|nr:hypothetical protein [Flavobacteriales bacterium]